MGGGRGGGGGDCVFCKCASGTLGEQPKGAQICMLCAMHRDCCVHTPRGACGKSVGVPPLTGIASGGVSVCSQINVDVA